MDFKYDKTNCLFQAFSEGPIKFLNNALGYEVAFILTNFTVKLYNEKDEISYDRRVTLGRIQCPDFESMDRWRTEMARKYMCQRSWIKIENKEPIVIDTSFAVFHLMIQLYFDEIHRNRSQLAKIH